MARLANRIIQVTRQEADNSEDAAVSAALEPVAGRLKESEFISKTASSLLSYRPSLVAGIEPVVVTARALALDIGSAEKAKAWNQATAKVRRTSISNGFVIIEY